MTITIRLATDADAAAIACLQIASWQSAYAGLLPASFLARLDDESRTQDWRRLLVQGTHTVWVAESVEGEIVGFSCVRPDPTLSAPAPIFVTSLHVAPYLHRRGIGQALMATITNHYREAGAPALYLWVLEDNAPARRFYEALGGEICGRERHDLAGAVADEVAYRWRLAPTV